MKTTHSFSIDFIIRKCKEDKTKALIYARISVDSERKEISLKERIIASEWDGKNEVVNGRSIESKSINRAIEEYRFKIKQKYRELQEQDALITAASVKNAYLGIHTKLKGHSLVELLDYYDKIWKDKMKQGGFKNVETTIGYVKRYLAKQYPSGDILVNH